jgi:hypothetical protein
MIVNSSGQMLPKTVHETARAYRGIHPADVLLYETRGGAASGLSRPEGENIDGASQ